MEPCRAMLQLWDGEYDGECELAKSHEGRHWDGMASWAEDEFGSADLASVIWDDPAFKADRSSDA